MRLRRCLFAAAVTLWPAVCFSVSVEEAEPEVHVARGVGLAAIYNNDIPQAEYEAKASARVHALESLGVRVTSQVYSDYKSILDDVVKAETEGYIVAERVARREEVGDGLYEVEIEAWVRTALTPEEKEKRRRKMVVVVDVPERIRRREMADGQDHPERVVQEVLKDSLIARGFQVYTLRDMEELQRLRRILADLAGKTAHLERAMDWTLAGVLVHGEVESRFTEAGPEVEDYFGQPQQGLWYRAFPRITASEAQGMSIPGGNVHIARGVKAYHLDQDRASWEALVACGEEVAPELVEALVKFAELDQVTFRVEIEGLPDLGQYRRFKRILGKLRWVVRADAGEQFEAGGKGVYTLVYKEKPFLLMSQLHRIPGLEVVSVSGYRVRARYSGR